MITEKELALYDFWESVAQDNCGVVQKKIDSVDLNAFDGWGRTVLHKAVMYCSLNAIDLLIKQPSLNTDARDKSGRTAVDLVQDCKYLEARKTMLLLLKERYSSSSLKIQTS